MADSPADGAADGTAADRVVLAARIAEPAAGLDPERVIEAVSTRAYRRYLGRSRAGPVAVEGGSSVGPDTAFAFAPA